MSKRAPNPYKALSQRLFDALLILKDEYTNTQIHELIVGKKSTTGLSYETFNKCKNGCKRPAYLKHLKKKYFLDSFEVIDSVLAKEPFCYVWNNTTQRYSSDISSGQQTYFGKINGLAGTWQGFSWNKERSEDTEANFNVFRVEVIPPRGIRVQTKNADFTNGMIHCVGDDCIAIELSIKNRKAYLTASVGKSENLSTIQILHLTYTDTGHERVKSGLAIFKKMNGTAFHDLPFGSQPLSSFNEEDRMLVSLLEKKQFEGKIAVTSAPLN